MTGEDRLSLLATEGPPATRAWIERLARRESPMLHTQEISPCQAAEDMLARIWIETLKRERQQLDSADEAQAGRRALPPRSGSSTPAKTGIRR